MKAMTASPVPQREWDAFVAGHVDGGFLQSWRWGQLKSKSGWRAIRLGVRQDGQLAAGLQVLVRARPLWPGGPRLGLGYVPRGPLADTSERAEVLVTAAVKVARSLGASFVRVEPPGDLAVPALQGNGFRPTSQFVQIPRTAIVDLTPSLTEILAGFKPKMRYNIRLATRHGVDISSGRSERNFDAFMRLLRITSRREGFAIHNAAYYRDVLQVFRHDNGNLLVARHDGCELAAIIVIGWGQTAAYAVGASSNTRRNLMAPHVIQWAGMQWARAQGFKRYDLWGMANPRDPMDQMAGVHRFKLGFNPRLISYPGTFDVVLQPIRARMLNLGLFHARHAIDRIRSRVIGAV